jgi:NAD(P)H-nitrite reductase large subunit
MPRRHVLIGCGPASISAAQTIRGLDGAAHITIVNSDPNGYYSRPGLAYYLAKEVPEERLAPFTGDDLSRLNADLVSGRAVGIDRAARVVALADGRALPYDRLLLATGSAAISVGVPGADFDGVTKLDNMDDARDLIKRSRHAKTAVVVGGGITALEIAEGLRAHRVHVHYFMRRDRYWGNVLSEKESSVVEDGLRARGVEIHHFTELVRVLGRDGRLTGVETADGTQIACNLLAVAIGVLPQKQLAEEADLDCGRGVLVDQYLRSNDPSIFAAGDIAEVCEESTDRRTLDVLWSAAVAKGRIAGHNMAHEPMLRYDEGAPLNVTRLAGFKITIMGSVGNGQDSDLQGLSRGDSDTWADLGESTMLEVQDGPTHLRLALGERTILGAVVMGDQALSFPLQDLIGHRVDVGSIVPTLLEPDAAVAQIITDFWEGWAVSGV